MDDPKSKSAEAPPPESPATQSQQPGNPNVLVLPPEAVQAAAAKGLPVQVTIATAHIGPFPPPDVLRAYDEIVSGLSQILVDEFQKEAKHRRLTQSISQLGTLSIAALSIIVGAILGYLLKSWPAALAVIGPFCGAVGTAQLLEYWFKAK
jgi:uncharacterized membrane protein